MLQIYDYLEAEVLDIVRYVTDNYSYIDIKIMTHEELYDELFVEDSVTGNASGSYTFNTLVAEKNLVGNWELLNEAFENLDIDKSLALENGAEYCDVIIRCYLLDAAMDEALKEVKKEH